MKEKTLRIYQVALVFIILGLIVGAIALLMHLDILTFFNNLFKYILIAGCILLAIGLLIALFNKISDKRENITFDGTTINFRTNNKVTQSYQIKDIEQMIPYRSQQGIAYGLANALAFRMAKDQPWVTIDSSYRDLKNKKKYTSSIHLIKSIVQDFSSLKTQRAIPEIDENKGVRFTYLIVKDTSMNSVDTRNEYLKTFEQQLLDSNESTDNTHYGNFTPNKLIVTKDALFVNKTMVATNKENNYVNFRSKFNAAKDDFYFYEVADFYNSNHEIICSIDLALVINSDFFKMLIQSVFATETHIQAIQEKAV